jgi:hypothetical protein
MASVHSSIDLELDPFGGVAFTELGGAIRIHRKIFRFAASKDWVGNWCWNRYWFDPREYRRLIRTMAAKGWRCTGGLARWGEAYERLSLPPSAAGDGQ